MRLKETQKAPGLEARRGGGGRMRLIDLREKIDLRTAEVGTRVISTKGFEFVLISRTGKLESWKDLTSGLIWYDIEPEKYNHYQAVKKFGDALPTIEEFEEAEKHGFRDVLPNMQGRWFWSSSLVSDGSDSARYFGGSGGSAYRYYRYGGRDDDYSVRCVAR